MKAPILFEALQQGKPTERVELHKYFLEMVPLGDPNLKLPIPARASAIPNIATLAAAMLLNVDLGVRVLTSEQYAQFYDLMNTALTNYHATVNADDPARTIIGNLVKEIRRGGGRV